VKVLALDLQFPGLYEVIHFSLAKTAEFRTFRPAKGSRFFDQKRRVGTWLLITY
jgi:hypothetical protein